MIDAVELKPPRVKLGVGEAVQRLVVCDHTEKLFAVFLSEILHFYKALKRSEPRAKE